MNRQLLPGWRLPSGLLAGLLLAGSLSALDQETWNDTRPLRNQEAALLASYSRAACDAVLLQGDTLYYGSGRVLEARLLLPDGESQVLGRRVLEENILELHLSDGLVVVKTLNTVQLLADQPPNFPRLGVLETWSGFPYTLRTWQDALYLATFNGVDVYDLQDPQSPVLVNTLLGGSPCYGLEVRDGRMYVKGRGAGNQFMLSSFSLADPLDPEPRAQQITAPSYMQGMCTREGVLFSIEGVNLASYDISLPGQIAPLGNIQLSSMSFLVTASQESPLLVVSDYPQGARLLNVSDPGAIVPLPPLWNSPIVGVSVDWAGQRLVISSGDPVLTVFDLENPEAPVLTHRIDHGGGVSEGLAVWGERLAAAYYGGVVRLLPADGNGELQAQGRLDGYRGLPVLAATAQVLAVADSLNLDLYTLDETEPALLARLPLGSRPATLALDDAWLAGAEVDGTLRVWSLADPAAPQELPGLALPGSGTARLLALEGGLLAARGSSLRYYTYDEGFVEAGGLELTSPVIDLAGDAGRLLVLEQSGTLRLLDLDPGSLFTTLASVPASGALWVSLEDGWASVLWNTREWRLLDLRDPGLPQWSGSSDALPMVANSQVRAGHSLYTASSAQGIHRLRNTLANHEPLWQPPQALVFEEDGSSQLELAETWQDPDLDHASLTVQSGAVVSAVLTGTHLELSAPADWFGQDTLTLFLQDGYSTEPLQALLPVTVTPVNDSPVLAACGLECNTEPTLEDLALLALTGQDLDGDSLDLRWYADGEQFAQVRLGSADDCQPLPLELLPAGTTVLHAELWDGQVLVNGGGQDCAWTLQLTGIEASLRPGQWELAAPAPNPFNPETRITAAMGSAGPVELVVYDLLGRRVETLWQGLLEPGEHDFRWNGSRQASGCYLLVMEGPGGRTVRRMTLLK